MWGDGIGEAYGTGGLGLVGRTERARAVEVREVVAYGANDAHVMLTAIGARERLASCYPGDEVVPGHETSLEAVLRLDASGRVQSATVSGGPAEFVEFRRCLAKVLGSVEFSSALEADAPAGVALQLLVGRPDRDALSEPGLRKSPAPSGSPAPGRYPLIRKGAVTVSGRLPREVIDRVVRQIFGRFRLCYERGLSQNPALAGTIKLRFGIARDGSVFTVSTSPSDRDPKAHETSVFTRTLLRHIARPAIPVKEAFAAVAADVQRETDGKQVPWSSSNFTGEFAFRPCPEAVDPTV